MSRFIPHRENAISRFEISRFRNLRLQSPHRAGDDYTPPFGLDTARAPWGRAHAKPITLMSKTVELSLVWVTHRHSKTHSKCGLCVAHMRFCAFNHTPLHTLTPRNLISRTVRSGEVLALYHLDHRMRGLLMCHRGLTERRPVCVIRLRVLGSTCGVSLILCCPDRS